MMKRVKMVKKFVEYKDRKKEDGKDIEIIRSGIFEIIEETENWVKFWTEDNIIKIPHHQILKIKEKK